MGLVRRGVMKMRILKILFCLTKIEFKHQGHEWKKVKFDEYVELEQEQLASKIKYRNSQ